jgi:hypothetical protein
MEARLAHRGEWRRMFGQGLFGRCCWNQMAIFVVYFIVKEEDGHCCAQGGAVVRFVSPFMRIFYEDLG